MGCSTKGISLLFAAFSFAIVLHPAQAWQKCYSPYGCFLAFKPYTTLFGLPQSPSFLRTSAIFRTGTSKPCTLSLTKGFAIDSVEEECFKADMETKVIIHGAFESSSVEWVQDLANQSASTANVIVIDWSAGAGNLFRLGGNIRLVARQVAMVLHKLIQEPVLNPQQVHMIGFSAGAYVAGQVGKILKDEQLPIRRITGLDPPKPIYLMFKASAHPMNAYYREAGLDDTDALFVDVVHTDIDFVGLKHPVGHVDFYPNGGNKQPGCDNKWHEDVSALLGCDHLEAPLYYANAIRSPCRYAVSPCPASLHTTLGYQCQHGAPNMTYMGPRAEQTKPSRRPVAYYVDTENTGHHQCM